MSLKRQRPRKVSMKLAKFEVGHCIEIWEILGRVNNVRMGRLIYVGKRNPRDINAGEIHNINYDNPSWQNSWTDLTDKEWARLKLELL